MKNVERFRKVLNFQPVDRLPEIEWAHWWHLTIERWRQEGLPQHLELPGEIRDYFGQDSQEQIHIDPYRTGIPAPAYHGAGIIKTQADYNRIQPYLYPKESFIRQPFDMVRNWSKQQEAGDTVVWVSLKGFFGWPRQLLGIERHLFAFYDQPELMHEINQDLCDFNCRAIEELARIVKPTFMTFLEDLSYNHGPMLSEQAFDTFLAPYYRQLIPVLEKYGITPIIDSDGDITRLVPWFQRVGIRGILPLERMAGVDVNFLREAYHDFILIGGFDKMVMKNGEAAMRQEFERLLPAMKKGGFIPSVDHQTPPDVPLENYDCYLKLLHEYCVKAGQ